MSSTMAYPQWNFGFANTVAGTTSLQSWGGGPWGSRSYPYYQLYAPNNAGGWLVDYLYNGEFVRIDNVAFWIYFAYDSPILNPGSGFNVSGSINANGPYCVQNSCTFSWTCTYASSAVSPYGVYPSSTGAIPFAGTAYWETIGSSSPQGYVYSGCLLTSDISDPPYYQTYTTFVFYTFVN